MRENPGVFVVLLLLMVPPGVFAQEYSRTTIEVSGGYAGFLDESAIPHGTVGAAVRWDLGRHISIGPEFVYMQAENDSDLFLTGKVVIDGFRDRAVSPYFVADGGLMLHRATFFRGAPFWSQEGAASFGGGARFRLTPRVFLAPELRIGWEPHIRVGVTVGWKM